MLARETTAMALVSSKQELEDYPKSLRSGVQEQSKLWLDGKI